jgi:hypothetical protein
MLGKEMSNGFAKDIEDALKREASMEEVVSILRDYQDQGMTAKSAAEALETLRVGADERTEDRLLEILDIVTGFCRPHLRVWNKS